jgi:teichuronic acid biosynthesis glycosyltransferase TuaH
MSELVVMSLEPWDDVWRRNQYLVAELLRADETLRVLFVEPPADPLHDVRHGRTPRWRSGVRAVDDVAAGRLHTFRPTKLLPRRLAPRGDGRRAAAVVKAARRAGLRAPTLWVNDLQGAVVLRATGWPALYDVTDDWLAAERSPAENARLRDAERYVLDRADAVTVCSPALARAKGADRPVRLVTNGVDAERYDRPTERPADLPPGRHAVYAGTLHGDRLDVDLCVRTAALLAGQATLTFVGPSALGSDDERRLQDAGVLMLGARRWDEVPGYLQHADALVVPHVVDAFTDSLDPLKLYEYRAVGRPVVATPVAGFRDSADPLVEAVGAEAFPAAVAAAVRRPRVRRAVPQDLPTWTTQAALVADALPRAEAGSAAGTSTDDRPRG